MEIKKFTPRTKKEIEMIYEMYEGLIKRVTTPILGDAALAEDCLHEVILRLASVLDRVGELGSKRAKTFIIVVARHLALDMLKKKIREICVDEEDESNEAIFDPEGTYDKYFIDENGFSEEMREYLGRLSEQDRHALILRYTFDLPYESIARTLGIKKNAVEQRVCRARKKLEKMIMTDRGKEENG